MSQNESALCHGNALSDDHPREPLSIDDGDGRLCRMPRFAQSGACEVARRDEDPLRSVTQCSSETIDLWASDCVPPSLYLGLHVGSLKKVVTFVHVRVDIDSTIS